MTIQPTTFPLLFPPPPQTPWNIYSKWNQKLHHLAHHFPNNQSSRINILSLLSHLLPSIPFQSLSHSLSLSLSHTHTVSLSLVTLLKFSSLVFHKTQIQSLFQSLTLHPTSLIVLQTCFHQIIFLFAMIRRDRRNRWDTRLEGIHLFLLLGWVESRGGSDGVGLKGGIATNVDALKIIIVQSVIKSTCEKCLCVHKRPTNIKQRRESFFCVLHIDCAVLIYHHHVHTTFDRK
jgi:hypothetical protein